MQSFSPACPCADEYGPPVQKPKSEISEIRKSDFGFGFPYRRCLIATRIDEPHCRLSHDLSRQCRIESRELPNTQPTVGYSLSRTARR